MVPELDNAEPEGRSYRTNALLVAESDSTIKNRFIQGDYIFDINNFKWVASTLNVEFLKILELFDVFKK